MATSVPLAAGPVPLAVGPAPAVPAPPPVRIRRPHTKGDPLEGINRALFSVHRVLDRILFRPVAIAYKTVVPKIVRTGIRHAFSNLTEPVVFLNDLLQLKPKRAVRTVARFTLNSTFGIGGLLDVAKTKDLPHRENGFGDTLARYGVGPGPYFFIPFIGPTTLRDFIGGSADSAVLPAAIGDPFDRGAFTITRQVLTGLDLRAENDAGYKALLDSAADPYASLRSVYLQGRAAEIAEIKGQATGTAGLDDPLADPEAPTAPAPESGPATDPADTPTAASADTSGDPPTVPANPAPATETLPASPAPAS